MLREEVSRSFYTDCFHKFINFTTQLQSTVLTIEEQKNIVDLWGAGGTLYLSINLENYRPFVASRLPLAV